MGGLTMVLWVIRLFSFNLPESPTYLISGGRDEDAVAVVHRVAIINGKSSSLTVAKLKEAEMLAGGSRVQTVDNMVATIPVTRKLSEFYANHVRPLFEKPEYSMSILIVVWGKA